MLLNSRMILVCDQMCEHRDALKAQIEVNKPETEQYVLAVEQLRLELEQSRTAGEEAKHLQAQQGLEIENLKVALANGMANLRHEHEAKQQSIKER